MTDLSLVSIEAMVDEIQRRYEHIIVGAVRKRHDKQLDLYHHFDGDTAQVVFLCEMIKLKILDEHEDKLEDSIES